MTQNPLQNYFRHADLYISLPSNGRWWPPGSIDMPENNEIPVSSMTGLDDIAMKNADGLMNGDTSVRVIHSCCPAIKNAWDMPTLDLDTLFIAIRIASYGHQMEFETKCNSCNAQLDYAIDLREVLQNIRLPNYDQPIVVNDLTFFLKPATYKAMNLDSQELYQQQRAFTALKSTSMTDQEKEKVIKEALARMTEITVNRIHDYIDKIIINDTITVTDKDHIAEFVAKADVKTFTSLKEGIEIKNKEYNLPSIPITCDECNHTDTREVQFDPSTFFAKSS